MRPDSFPVTTSIPTARPMAAKPSLRRACPPLSHSFQPLDGRAPLRQPHPRRSPQRHSPQRGPLEVPLDGNDADVSDGTHLHRHLSDNPNVVPTIAPSTDRSLKIAVNHASSGAGGTAITNETMILKLFEDKAPKTTARIIALAIGFYNGLTFHRVINGFMIQGGDPLGNGTGGSGVQFDDEFDPSLHSFTGPGLLAMAKSNDDTDDSQFITESEPRDPDFQHTIFGQLVEGESTREKASNVPTDANDKPLSPVTMTSVTVIPTSNSVLSLAVPNNHRPATITVTAKDPAGHTVTRTFTVTIGPDTNNDNPFLGTIADVTTAANTPASVAIPTIDVDGGPQFFATGGDPNASVHYAFDFTSGTKVIVTPSNNFAGVVPLLVAPDSAGSSFDTQAVPVFITPAPPTSIDLLDASDTGVSTTDNLTRLNNANASSKLQFQINGVVAGAGPTLRWATLLGTATVPAASTTVTLTTNGSASLSNGVHNLKAIQTLKNYAWTVCNRSGTLDLASVASATQAITVDTVAPTLTGTAAFDFKSATQSVPILFSENVSASLTASDIILLRVDDNSTTPAASIPGDLRPGQQQSHLHLPRLSQRHAPQRQLHRYPHRRQRNRRRRQSPHGWLRPGFWSCRDINLDRSVGFSDLVTIAQNYGKTGMNFTQGDVNADGTVSFADLVIIAQNYGKSVPATAPTPAADPIPAATTEPATPPIAAQPLPPPSSQLLQPPPESDRTPARPAVETKTKNQSQRRPILNNPNPRPHPIPTIRSNESTEHWRDCFAARGFARQVHSSPIRPLH